MYKVGALYKNEMIKLFHKRSLIIIMVIALLIIFAVGVLWISFRDAVIDPDDDKYKDPDTAYKVLELNKKNYSGNEGMEKKMSELREIIDGYREKYGDEVDYSILGNDISEDFLLSVSLYTNTDKSVRSILGVLSNLLRREDVSAYPNVSDKTDYLINKSEIIEYRLKECEEEYLIKNNEDGISTSITTVMLMVAFSVTLVLVIILAGGTISHEISSGSIKSLIIAPVKRSKIFIAKFFALVTTGFLAYAVCFVFIMIYNLILFGFNDTSFIVSNGTEIHSFSVYLKFFLQMLISYPVIICFTAIAMMLSAVTRSTAASVGAAIGIYSSGSVIVSVLSYFINGIFIKILPFTHFQALSGFDLMGGSGNIDLLFKYTQNSSYVFFRSYTEPGFIFSLIYVLIFTALTSWIAFDAFTKKDI